jgi:hypothetical protein
MKPKIDLVLSPQAVELACRTMPPVARLLDPLRQQYRELLDLRERIREAEAAAAPKRIRRPLLAEDWMRLAEAEELIHRR